MKNIFDNDKLDYFETMEHQRDFMKIMDERDTRKFRQESRENSRHTSIVSYIAIAIALASLLVSIFK